MTITVMDWLLDYTTKVVLAHICIIVLSIYAPVGSWLPLAVVEERVIEGPLDAWRTAANCVPTACVGVWSVCEYENVLSIVRIVVGLDFFFCWLMQEDRAAVWGGGGLFEVTLGALEQTNPHLCCSEKLTADAF